MSDLISRQDFDKQLESAEKEALNNNRFVFASALSTIRGNLKIFPSAQPEIIRCKDCKYHVIHTLFGRTQAWCERLCDQFDKSLAHCVESDDYCSRAERRTDE